MRKSCDIYIHTFIYLLHKLSYLGHVEGRVRRCRRLRWEVIQVKVAAEVTAAQVRSVHNSHNLLYLHTYTLSSFTSHFQALHKAPFTLKIYFEILFGNFSFEHFYIGNKLSKANIVDIHLKFVNTGQLTNHNAP